MTEGTFDPTFMDLMSYLLIRSPLTVVMSIPSSSPSNGLVLSSKPCSCISDMKHICLNIFSLCLSFLGFLRPIGGFLSLLPVIRITSTSVSCSVSISVITSVVAPLSCISFSTGTFSGSFIGAISVASVDDSVATLCNNLLLLRASLLFVSLSSS